MKQKFFFLCLCGCFLTANAWAADIGFRYIKSRGEVLCGTDLDSETYAYKDEAGYWRGIDADLCRVFSIAIFGRSDKFRLVNVKENQVNSAIAHNKIDIMLGNAPGTAEAGYKLRYQGPYRTAHIFCRGLACEEGPQDAPQDIRKARDRKGHSLIRGKPHEHIAHGHTGDNRSRYTGYQHHLACRPAGSRRYGNRYGTERNGTELCRRHHAPGVQTVQGRGLHRDTGRVLRDSNRCQYREHKAHHH